MQILSIKTPEEIALCFDTFSELRPHLKSEEEFINSVLIQQKEGYEICALKEDSEVIAAIGFRFLTTLAWGKILYIDDLITRAKDRGKGCGKILLDHAISIAKKNFCKEIHLDSGYTRNTAHRFYLKAGFELSAHHLSMKIK